MKKFDELFPHWKENLFAWSITVLIVGGGMWGFYSLVRCSDKQMEEEYQASLYEIEVINKYDCIGSSFHLIGGRASEQEYHVVYKVKPLTETAKKRYYGTGEEDDEVSYKNYRKLNIGEKFTGHSVNLLNYYYNNY